MADLKQLEYFVLRYVPDAVNGEFINFGLILMEPIPGDAVFAKARFISRLEACRLPVSRYGHGLFAVFERRNSICNWQSLATVSFY